MQSVRSREYVTIGMNWKTVFTTWQKTNEQKVEEKQWEPTIHWVNLKFGKNVIEIIYL